MGEVRPFEVARTGPREGGGAPVYGPVLGTPATPEAVGGLGRRVWLLRTARAQRAREAPPLGRGGGSFRAAVRTALLYNLYTLFSPPPPILYSTTRVGVWYSVLASMYVYNVGEWGMEL